MFITRKRWEALELEVDRAKAAAADAASTGHAALARGAVAMGDASSAKWQAAAAQSTADTAIALANGAQLAADTAFEEGKRRGAEIAKGAVVVVNPMVDPDGVATRVAEAIERTNYPAAAAKVSERVGRYDDDAD